MKNEKKLKQHQEIINGLSNQDLFPTRVKALKSLALLLLNELDFIESLHSFEEEKLKQNGSINFDNEVEHFERDLIRNALLKTKGHQKRAADLLGLKLTTLHAKLKRYNINPRSFIDLVLENPN